MSEMVERVAIASCGMMPCLCEHRAKFDGMDFCLHRARKAIAAMREPTEAMMDNGSMVRGNHQPFGSPRDWNNDTDCAGIWRSMIDAALE